MKIKDLTLTEQYRVYFDWWITIRAWELEFPCKSKGCLCVSICKSFDEFMSEHSLQINGTLAKEWLWKYPNSYKL